MECVEGEMLGQRLTHGAIELDEALRIAIAIAGALDKAHRKGITPFWSPDSRALAFFEDGILRKADISGGPASNISEAPPPFGGGTWNRHGVILFASQGLIRRVLA